MFELEFEFEITLFCPLSMWVYVMKCKSKLRRHLPRQLMVGGLEFVLNIARPFNEYLNNVLRNLLNISNASRVYRFDFYSSSNLFPHMGFDETINLKLACL